MLVETLVMLLSAAAPQKPPAVVVAPVSALYATPAPTYQPDRRAVDNWRSQSAMTLEMSPLAALRRAADAEEKEPTRCVKLNNYWCVKRAGWNGEIAADADGHVAFASAEEGAAVAALLLRRYYVDYKRRTARAIVERWAPAQCSPMIAGPMAGRGHPGEVASRAGMARMIPQRIVSMGLAPRGIQNTLRARWLAAHGRGGVPALPMADAARDREIAEKRELNEKLREAGRRRVDAYRAAHGLRVSGMMPAPAIMEGGGEAPGRAAPSLDVAASSPPTTASTTPFTPSPGWAGFSCSGELTRIANYAAAVAQGVAASPNMDLRLFDEAGRPTENLAKVMANMAAVEIGPDRPRRFLIDSAVAQLRLMLESPAAAALAAKRAPPEAESAEPVAERAPTP